MDETTEQQVEIQPIEVSTTTIPEFVINREKYKFLDEEFIEDIIKFQIFCDAVNFVKANVNAPNKSTKISFCFVMYRLIKEGIVIDNDSMMLEFNNYLNHVNTNFNQFNIDLSNKYTLQDKFIKFSNYYLLEKLNEQIHPIQEIQQDVQL